MKLLKTQEEFEAWESENIYPGDIADQPREFPCYARTIVNSWNYQEERAVYLYRGDLEEMLAGMGCQ